MNNIELDTYTRAINAHAMASGVLYKHVVNQTEPTTTQIQRIEDARVMLAAAKATYFAAAS
jgi:hypothetical protein